VHFRIVTMPVTVMPMTVASPRTAATNATTEWATAEAFARILRTCFRSSLRSTTLTARGLTARVPPRKTWMHFLSHFSPRL